MNHDICYRLKFNVYIGMRARSSKIFRYVLRCTILSFGLYEPNKDNYDVMSNELFPPFLYLKHYLYFYIFELIA
jgi:hypothetical protein